MKHFKKIAVNTALTAFSCLLLLNPINAQTIIAAGTTDNDVPMIISSNPDNFATVNTINCDMFENSHGGKFWATVVEGTTSTAPLSVIYAQYNGANYYDATIQLPASWNVKDPDLVINDNLSTTGVLGEDYVVTIIYTNSATNKIMTATYLFWHMGLSTGSKTPPTFSGPVNSGPSQLSVPGAVCAHPHIDLAPNKNLVSGFYRLRNYAAVWDEQLAPNLHRVRLSIGDVTSIAGAFEAAQYTLPISTTDACYPDVAYQTPIASTSIDNIAWVTYKNSSSNQLGLTKVTVDYAGPIITSTSSVLQNNLYTINQPPRIEAQTRADITSNVASYTVVASDGSDIYAYDDATASLPSAVFSLTTSGPTTYPNYSACVTGVGPNLVSPATGIGASNFSVSYYSRRTYPATPPFNGYYYNNSVDISGGMTSFLYPNYYQVNKSSLENTVNASAGTAAMGITTTTNSGDNLLTVYWAGVDPLGQGHVNYKFAGNTYAYKPTSIASEPSDIDLKVYPNPATGYLAVSGINNGNYTITDLLGRTINKGHISNIDTRLNIQTLVAGTYILNVSFDNISKQVKFQKVN